MTGEKRKTDSQGLAREEETFVRVEGCPTAWRVRNGQRSRDQYPSFYSLNIFHSRQDVSTGDRGDTLACFKSRTF